MSQNVAPWLQGLDEVWETPQIDNEPHAISLTSQDASSACTKPRISSRSLSGLPANMTSNSPHGSARITRNPLAPINNSSSNTLQRNNDTVKLNGTRSVSVVSDGSAFGCGTVQIQPRAKSTSPKKNQETLEWQKRLMRGQVGYGDQTDLFGPSGLENIFVPSSSPGKDASAAKGRRRWLQQNESPMPSSPPDWNSKAVAHSRHGDEDTTEDSNGHMGYTGKKEDRISSENGLEIDGSMRSNPFDLQCTDELERRAEQIQYSDTATQEDCSDAADVGNHIIEGNSGLSQEDFSPVFISKHTTLNGQVNYAAIDSRVLKGYHRNSQNSNQQQISPESPREEEQQEYSVQESSFVDGPSSASPYVPRDLSLSENLPTGTPPVVGLGKHVELQRGGYSAYGSFKRRLLSPSPSKAEDSFKAETSRLTPVLSDGAALEEPSQNSPTTPLRPQTPSPVKSRSSGSPLKLFGAHDTFTNNRLSRRLSQLDRAELSIEGEVESSKSSRPQRGSDDRRVFSQASSSHSFGSGRLNKHRFDAEITITGASDSEDDGDQSPDSHIRVPGSKAPHAFKFESSPNMKDTFNRRGKQSNPSTMLNVPQHVSSFFNAPQRRASNPKDSAESREKHEVFETGKRPANSPAKNPTPKRQRTLHAADIALEVAEADTSHGVSLREASSSRKRKDARHGENHIIASPDVLAQRTIIRPRNFTPNHVRQQKIEAQIKQAAEEFATEEPEKLEAVMEQIEESLSGDAPPTLQQQAEAVAAEVAAYSIRVTKPSGEHSDMGERKRSVTTQDFFNEAVMVMNLIRAKALRQSGLGSVEESDESGQSIAQDDSMLGAQSLRISRPPSRESGPSGWRQPVQRQFDARVVSHLRKFQERDDTEFIAESLGSLKVDEEEESFISQEYAVDEHSNIRITGPPLDKKNARPEDTMDALSQRSHGSDGPSTGRTAGTNCTKNSDNVGTLAPDAVAHLIGEQVGVMTFDKEKQCWVRVKSPEKKRSPGLLEPPSQISSDEDPFQEISDLPVDEQLELRRVSATVQTGKAADSENRIPMAIEPKASIPKQQFASAENRITPIETVNSRPVTRDSSHIRHMHSSSVRTRNTAFASSQQEKVETRATSWSEEELARMTAIGKARNQPLAYAAAQVALDQRKNQAGHGEQSTLSADQEEPHQNIVDADNSFEYVDETGLTFSLDKSESDLRDDTALEAEDFSVEAIRSPKLRQSHEIMTFPATPRYQGAARQSSLRRKTLANKFQAEVRREESELSLIAALPGDRMVSLSVSVLRPLSARQGFNRIQDLNQSPSHQDSSFLLSDLPDFTIHQEDHERPSERALATRLARHAAAEVNDRYALAVKDLIKILTDVQEEEPYWEYVKQLDLRDRSLESLFGLEDFCSHVQVMDVSDNHLAHLGGAPSTIRKLVARSNRLSSLTSWTCLTNLQYLDISGNSLDSLRGLNNLIHLRELHADDNQISTLDGVLELDGLLKLRLRRNQLQQVDFNGSELHQLTDLDLGSNKITSIAGLNELHSLRSLKLDKTRIASGLQLKSDLPALEELSLQGCELETLNVGMLPTIRILNVDDNCLTDVQNIESLRGLELLSMRRQKEVVEGDKISILEHALEARTILLSGNSIGALSLSNSFLNLHHLELASVGLNSLPDDFGLRMPNLRTLNLNFNAIQDVRPLLNIQKLNHLSICGNRIKRLRKSVATFAKMTALRSLDMRDNPITQGYYLPATTTQTSIVRKDAAFIDEDDARYIQEMELAKQNLPSIDVTNDIHHWDRLSEETKLRRRVYEILLANSCQSLDVLDGMKFDRSRTAVKDGVFERLVELGILRKSSSGPTVS
ncbi:Hypothetical protein R9X50_00736400 [Acrodontium crateriforme]|uniref:Septation initiation network scaffold protein cdc11 n=1 Tax=Acrodontium crateriforme TaxID=150365 RepID=A0AAQ3MBQ7_9PEZI|nr:Hypothetical protein R9X50_00736400 [Acrodontium crateriforme]